MAQSQANKIVGDKYELGRVLGEGATATVRIATELSTGKQYACKVMSLQRVTKEKQEESVKREINILKTLRHENVVWLKEVLQSKRHIYIFMEYVNGGDLVQELRRQPEARFSEDVARRYFQQLVMGLRYCHQLDIAHRDLKPMNLLLDTTGALKISDFGFAQMAGDEGMMTTICGTPHFVAPEVLSRSPYNGCRTDIWSCGVILYVMLTGGVPFDDPNVKATRQYDNLWSKIRKGEFQVPTWCSASVQDLLSRMIQVDVEQRCTLEFVIGHPWFNEGFNRERLAEGMRVEAETGEAITEEPSGIELQIQQSMNPLLQQDLTGAQLDAFALCDHLRQYVFNSDKTFRVFYYHESILGAMHDILEFFYRLSSSLTVKTSQTAFEIRATGNLNGHFIGMKVSLESLALSERTLVHVSPSDGTDPRTYDETIRSMRACLKKPVSEEIEPQIEM